MPLVQMSQDARLSISGRHTAAAASVPYTSCRRRRLLTLETQEHLRRLRCEQEGEWEFAWRIMQGPPKTWFEDDVAVVWCLWVGDLVALSKML